MLAWVCFLHLASYFWFVRKCSCCFCLILALFSYCSSAVYMTTISQHQRGWESPRKPSDLIFHYLFFHKHQLTSFSSCKPTSKLFKDKGGEWSTFIIIWYSLLTFYLGEKTMFWWAFCEHFVYISNSAGHSKHWPCQ